VWSASRPCRFATWETAAIIRCIENLVGSRIGIDYVEERKNLLTVSGIEPRQAFTFPNEALRYFPNYDTNKDFWTFHVVDCDEVL
jgi:hypothetical protein